MTIDDMAQAYIQQPAIILFLVLEKREKKWTLMQNLAAAHAPRHFVIV
jgi:hypothetical protein